MVTEQTKTKTQVECYTWHLKEKQMWQVELLAWWVWYWHVLRTCECVYVWNMVLQSMRKAPYQSTHYIYIRTYVDCHNCRARKRMASKRPLTTGDTFTSVRFGCQECQIQSMHLICAQTNTNIISIRSLKQAIQPLRQSHQLFRVELACLRHRRRKFLNWWTRH